MRTRFIRILLPIIFLFLLFSFPKQVSAATMCDLPMSDCQTYSGDPTEYCCRSSLGCSVAGYNLNQWDYLYAADCCGEGDWVWVTDPGNLSADDEPYYCEYVPLTEREAGQPAYECFVLRILYWDYQLQTCGATDTCYGTPYLYAGLCGDGGCMVGGRYKVCCNDDGTVDGNCLGGSFSGTCPSGTITKLCGWGDYPACDDPNVCGGGGEPEPTTAPGEPTPIPEPTSPSYCDWCDAMECCDSWIEVDVPEQAQVGDVVEIEVYQHNGWGAGGCYNEYLGKDNDSIADHLIAYGGEGSEGYTVDWDEVGHYYGGGKTVEYRLRNQMTGKTVWNRDATTEYGQKYKLDSVTTDDPVGHDWYNKRVVSAIVIWDTSDLPAGTYNFDNGPFGNVRYSGHSDNCGSNSQCCDKPRNTLGNAGISYTADLYMDQILGRSPNHMIRLTGEADKTCSLDVNVNGQEVTFNYSGNSTASDPENVLIYTKRDDAAQIPGFTDYVSLYNTDKCPYGGDGIKEYYDYTLASCSTSDGNTCSGSVTVTLPPGQYNAHCALPSDPKCSGSATCDYKNCAANFDPDCMCFDCSGDGWESCSANDMVRYEVVTPPSTCSIRPRKTVYQPDKPVIADLSGNPADLTTLSQGLRTWLEEKDGSTLEETVTVTLDDGTTKTVSSETWDGHDFYRLGEFTESKSYSVEVAGLVPGEYFLHCDLCCDDGTSQCSGNPFCDIKELKKFCQSHSSSECGSTDCSAYEVCEPGFSESYDYFCLCSQPTVNENLPLEGNVFYDNEVNFAWEGSFVDEVDCDQGDNEYRFYLMEVDDGVDCPTTTDGYGGAEVLSEGTTSKAETLSYDQAYCWGLVADNGCASSGFDPIYFEVTYPDAWFQTQGGDVYGKTGVSSMVFAEVTDPYFSIKLGGYSGFVVAGNKEPERSDFNDQGISESGDNWAAQADLSALARYDYQYFFNLLDVTASNSQVTIFDSQDEVGQPAASATHSYTDQSGYETTGSWSVGSDETIIILIDNDLTITDNITVASGGFLAFISTGDLTVNRSITDLQGVYIADGAIQIPGVTSGADTQLVAEGIFYAKGGFSLGRDLQTDNLSDPAELFQFAPQYLFTAPQEFRKKPYLWQEVAP